ncbi:hypothetical protein KAFR_0D00270 [Kazachstania africana CBS 2517]|uniref:Uncharacterized protein n=1 Tax=Kazachstania africana (strain ATCC 22294 / BCRC 22015 / CBS 2517 / CECT 1963 / NBRC 1671 / NRRL Y-8276) TaxID=1071382 RepID=H2ATH4_KAZAF|nr:hypothetical protein KAFR_0D00270 [Kazachstania africana CBS 2517]CCF57674.1 hypothetical protein KAFR_0D00270 [Kazachstania africana CBS 2517]
MSNKHILQYFVKNSKTFQIIDGPININNTENEVLLVLDSSFNPAHWGHYTLINKAVDYYRDILPQDTRFHVLLLLAIKNADKAPKPAMFPERMDMMCILANFIRKTLEDVNVSVGITSHGKFVDKDKDVKELFFTAFKNCRIAYLVGFDTIIRIMDAKYYVPTPLSVALQEFMQHAEFFCLTRDDDNNDIKKQINYSSDITEGRYEPAIPRNWGSKIHSVLNDNKYSYISSSIVRKQFSDGKRNLLNEVPEPILQYLVNESDTNGKSIFL